MTDQHSKPHGDDAERTATAVLSNVITDACDFLLGAVASYARPRLAGLIRRQKFRAAGYALAFMATVWASIGITLAAAQHLPLWASFLCVSAFLAVVAASAFIIPSLENGTQTAGREIT